MNDAITPGSLPARVLAHMLASRVEQTADEIAEELKADPAEVRQGLVTLRKLGKVLRREEDGHPVYRLPDAAHMRIAGSALQVIPSPRELRPEPKPAKAPAPEAQTPKEPTMTAKPPVKPGTDRARMLELIAEKPGLTGREIARALRLEQGKVTLQLQQMKERGLIEHLNDKKPFEWKAKAPTERADASTTAAPKPARAKPRRAKSAPAIGTTSPTKAKRSKAPRKLHDLGTPFTKPAPVGRAIDDPALAIDADGIVAIESVKLSPAGIRRAVAFLEKTQHVWQGASA